MANRIGTSPSPSILQAPGPQECKSPAASQHGEEAVHQPNLKSTTTAVSQPTLKPTTTAVSQPNYISHSAVSQRDSAKPDRQPLADSLYTTSSSQPTPLADAAVSQRRRSVEPSASAWTPTVRTGRTKEPLASSCRLDQSRSYMRQNIPSQPQHLLSSNHHGKAGVKEATLPISPPTSVTMTKLDRPPASAASRMASFQSARQWPNIALSIGFVSLAAA